MLEEAPASQSVGGARQELEPRAAVVIRVSEYPGTGTAEIADPTVGTATPSAPEPAPASTRQIAQSAEWAGTHREVLCASMCADAPRSELASARASATDRMAGARSWKMAASRRPKRWRGRLMPRKVALTRGTGNRDRPLRQSVASDPLPLQVGHARALRRAVESPAACIISGRAGSEA